MEASDAALPAASFPSPTARDLLDARDHLVGGLFDRDVVVDDAAHRLRPDVLVVEHVNL
jgi:hypothetical protein